MSISVFVKRPFMFAI